MLSFLIAATALPLAAQGSSLLVHPPAIPVISSLTESPDANTVLLSWTTNLAAATMANCGSQFAPRDNTQASVTSHAIAVPQLSPSTGYTCQACSGGGCQTISATTQAYATSTPITGVSLGALTDYNTAAPHAMSGDSYFNTVSNDGNTYIEAGDTSGYSGGASCAYASVVAEATSLSPLTFADVNHFATLTPGCTGLTPDGNLSPHVWSLTSVAGNLFTTWTNSTQCSGSPVCLGYYGSMSWSPDHGLTWNTQTSPGTFTSGGALNSPYTTRLSPNGPPYFDYAEFVQFGADQNSLPLLYASADNRVLNGNVYSYQISNAQNSTGLGISCAGDSYYLRRVPLSQLADLNPAEYTYYTGGDGTQAAAWSSTQTSAAAILTNDGNGTNLPSYPGELCTTTFQYIPALNRFLLATFYWPEGVSTSNNSTALFYDAATPWGPFTLVTTLNFPSSSGYLPGAYGMYVLQADALSATFASTTMRLLFSGDWQTSNYHMFYATMTVSH